MPSTFMTFLRFLKGVLKGFESFFNTFLLRVIDIDLYTLAFTSADIANSNPKTVPHVGFRRLHHVPSGLEALQRG
jgi:small nuclear ribonucleoprotein (snRNP)-like protein